MKTNEFEYIEENTILCVVNNTTCSILQKNKGKSKTFVFPVSQISKYSSQSFERLTYCKSAREHMVAARFREDNEAMRETKKLDHLAVMSR